jgi:hypothetical protein
VEPAVYRADCARAPRGRGDGSPGPLNWVAHMKAGNSGRPALT